MIPHFAVNYHEEFSKYSLYIHNMSSAPSEIFYLAQLVLVVSSLASNVNCGKNMQKPHGVVVDSLGL